MPVFNINGTNVNFPRTPYDCQLVYMSKVLEALDKYSNGLLESPTGTGKTLCLLCAVLAWQEKKILQFRGTTKAAPVILYCSRTHTQLSQVVSELKTTAYKPRMCVLGSRDQLCVNERLKQHSGTTRNNMCASLCSGRKCIYRNNLDSFNSAVEGVSALMDIEELVITGKKNRICSYYYARDQVKGAEIILLPYNYLLDPSIRATVQVEWNNVVIIVDEAHNLERSACEAASVTINTTALSAISKELQNTIRLLHGAERSSAEGEGSAAASSSSGGESKGGGDKKPPNIDVMLRLCESVFKLEGEIDQLTLRQDEAFGGTYSLPSTVLPGVALANMLEKCGFTFEQNSTNIVELNRANEYLMNESMSLLAAAGGASIGGGSVAPAPAEPKLTLLVSLLLRAFRGRNEEEKVANSLDYQLYICEEKRQLTQSALYSQQNNGGKRFGFTRKLNYWAFSPGIALDELRKLGVNSIILTSGTLSPLGSFQMDMRIPFPIQLENPHIIAEKQTWVGVLPTAVNGKTLNSGYQNRESVEYQEGLGNSIIQILRTGIQKSVPIAPVRTGAAVDDVGSGRITGMNLFAGGPGPSSRATSSYATTSDMVDTSTELTGGILIFFQSYDVMEKMVRKWKDLDIYDVMERLGGEIIMETRGSGNTSNNGNSNKPKGYGGYGGNNSNGSTGAYGGIDRSNPRNYANASGKTSTYDQNVDGDSSAGMFVNNSTAREDEEKELKDVVIKLDRILKVKKRCIIMAVFQGKISEGIDFKDSRGRIIIVTGIPFAPMKDPWVVLKRRFLDSRKMKLSQSNSKAPGSASVECGLDGASWYTQTAGRAVNQALGRIIRHKKDWGAIFLLDDRFLSPNQIGQLSKWIRPRVGKHKVFNDAMVSFRGFLTDVMSDPDLRVAVNPAEKPSRVILKHDDDSSGKGGDVITVQNSVLVPGDKLSSGVGFINPELLLSQANPAGQINSYSNSQLPSSSSSSTSSVPSQSAAPTQSQMDASFSASQMNQSTFVREDSASNANSNASGHGAVITKSSKQVGLAAFGARTHLNPFAVVRPQPSQSQNLSQSSSDRETHSAITTPSGISLPPPPPLAQSKVVSLTMKSSSLSGVSSSSTLLTTDIRQLVPKKKFELSGDEKKVILSNLKTYLSKKVPEEKMKRFNALLMDVKNHKFGSIENVRNFVCDLLRVMYRIPISPPESFTLDGVLKRAIPMHYMLTATDFQKVFEGLGCLLNSRHFDTYNALTGQLIRVFEHGSDAPPEAVVNNSKPSTALKGTNSASAAALALSSGPNNRPTSAVSLAPKAATSLGPSLGAGFGGKSIPRGSISDKGYGNSVEQLMQMYSQGGQSASAASALVKAARPPMAAAPAARSDPSKENVSRGTTPGESIANGTAGVGGEKPGVFWQPKKRIRLIVESKSIVGEAASSQKKPSDVSSSSSSSGDLFSTINMYKFGSKNGRSAAAATIPDRNSNPMKLECSICSDAAVCPCANSSCGHICCESCWSRWMKSKTSGSTCPVCRCPASLDTLKRIVTQSK